jgi:hypothetical protein
MHADAGRFCRGRAKDDQAAQKREAARGRETTAHHGPFHDFVLTPVGIAIPKSGSTDPAVSSKPGKTSHFRDRTGANGVIVPASLIPSGCAPNQILTFRPCPRKLPETQKSTDRTEQAS